MDTKTVTPEKAVILLNKQGITISAEEAIVILNFMYLLADIYLYDQHEG